MAGNHRLKTDEGIGDPPTFQSNSKPFRSPKFRTIECKNYGKGSCDKGDLCTFKHSNSTYASITRGTAAASPSCPSTNLHPKQSSQIQRICEHFMAKGTCKYGDYCKFSHVKPVNEDGVAVQKEERPETLLFNLKSIVKSFSRPGQFQNIGRFEEFLDVALKV